MAAESIDKIHLKRRLGTFGAMSTIIGAVVGSGIFISVKGVLLYTGSLGLNMVIWVLCGLIALGGSLCYTELATLVPESGGSWAYIRKGLGDAPAFVAAWCSQILTPVSCAVITLSCSEYFLSNFFNCGIPVIIVKLCSVVILWLALYINCSVKLATKVLKVLLVMKVASLTLIVCGGIYWMSVNGAQNLSNGFAGTTDDGWSIALAFYGGLWAYEGWETANYITEEVKDVHRTMPRAIIGSTTLVICLYVLVNLSYYSVLGVGGVLSSSAIAAEWGRLLVGDWSKAFSVIVALSMFGSVIATTFGTSRIMMAVARQGHTAQVLAMVSVSDNSPLISVVFRGVMSTIIVCIGDISSLINFFSFTAWLFYGMSFISLIIFKVKGYRSDDPDVFRVPFILPILMLLVSIYLVVAPIAADPQLPFLYAAIVMVLGLVFYFPFVCMQRQVTCFDKFTIACQLLLQSSLPDKDV